MLLTVRAQIYCISEKERKKKKKDFLREMCHMAIDAEVLWTCRPTKPMSGKFPYYFLQGFFPFLPVVMSIASFTETDGLLQQAQNDLVV